MKNRGKCIAFLAVLLVMCMLLAACGSKVCSICGKTFSGDGHNTNMGVVCDDCYNSVSGLSTTTGSNTGVMIAITVIVFIAVFAATSAVVYLVLQRVLPPEDTAPHSAQHRTQEIDDVGVQSLPRPRTQVSSAASGQLRSGEWICPRDHSRNTGPYCAACGAPRPQRQNTSQAARPVQSTAQASRPAGNSGYTIQNRQSYSSAPAAQQRTQAAAQPRQAAGTAQARPQTTAPTSTTQQRTQTAPAAQVQTQPATTQQERPYTGKFARKEQPTQETQSEPEYDAELLAAIFREAEQGDSNE